MSYCDVSFADEYFAKRAFSEAWSGDEKEKYLETATMLIKEYCVFEDERGVFTYEDEEAEEWLKKATCEQALYLLNLGKDPTQADKKTTLGIISTEGTTFDKSFAADILCIQCRKILENNGGIISSEATSNSRKIKTGKILK